MGLLLHETSQEAGAWREDLVIRLITGAVGSGDDTQHGGEVLAGHAARGCPVDGSRTPPGRGGGVSQEQRTGYNPALGGRPIRRGGDGSEGAPV